MEEQLSSRINNVKMSRKNKKDFYHKHEVVKIDQFSLKHEAKIDQLL